jgi:lipoyl-dependent peroxiredoxin
MAVESKASSTWSGDLMKGSGSVTPASGAFETLGLTWHARAESREKGSSPEELIAAAHAGCFAMALSHGLSTAGHVPTQLRTSATVTFQAGEGIKGIRLTVEGDVQGRGGKSEGGVPGIESAGSSPHHVGRAAGQVADSGWCRRRDSNPGPST